MTASIVVLQTDITQEILDELRSIENDGWQFAALCRQVLIEEWGARPDGIDRETWDETATGYTIGCLLDAVEAATPSEFVAKRLAMFSDKGLALSGLDRASYEREASFKRVLDYARRKGQ